MREREREREKERERERQTERGIEQDHKKLWKNYPIHFTFSSADILYVIS